MLTLPTCCGNFFRNSVRRRHYSIIMRQRTNAWLAGILVIAAVAIYIDLPVEHPSWLQNLLFWQPAEARQIKIHEGLDLQGGLRVLLQAKMPDGKLPDREALSAARQIIENRVNGLGVSEPLVQQQGDDKIVVELPGLSDPEQAIKTFGQTGLLEFVDAGFTPLSPGDKVETTYPKLYEEISQTPTPTATATPAATATPTVSATGTVTATTPVTGTVEAPTPPKRILTTVITGKDLRNASVSFDSTTGAPEVSFQLTSEGSKRFFDYTKTHINQFLAIVLDKEVISSPRVQAAISDQGRITGNFSLKEAQGLVIQLKYGALPVPLEVVENRSVGPTLGQDSVQRSIRAGLIGILAVALFMILYYRLPGFLAVLALGIYAAVVLALFQLIPVTLTLAGIAGFILSVGMAVDANVLIFERTKEELRAGKRLRMAIEAGFNRAWPSIRDSNASTLITCLILFWFGSQFGASIVKGFAVTLAIGVLVSLFTAITVTRTFLSVTRNALFGDELAENTARLRMLFGF